MNSSSMEFDVQNFDEFCCSLHRKCITEKTLEGKILTNYWPFIKFVKIFPHQTFALYGNVTEHTVET